MLYATTRDGERFRARDEKDLVRQMKRTNWSAPDRKGDYMIEVQNRVGEMTGTLVRTDANGFIEDLERLGLLAVERVDEK